MNLGKNYPYKPINRTNTRWLCSCLAIIANKHLPFIRGVSFKEGIVGKPDFSKYTIEELFDCKANIDKEAWPERYQEILDCMSALCSSPELKLKHDQLLFEEFCESFRDDLTLAIDDNILGVFRLFSKKARATVPSTFDGEVCPICQGQLNILNQLGGWLVVCEACNLDHLVLERHSNGWI